MTTDHNDPDGPNWQIARAVQPHIFMDRNNLSKLDPAHVQQMAIDRARGMGTWMRAVQIADAVIAVMPELQDDEPVESDIFGDVEDYLGPLTIRPLRHVE